MWPAAVANRYPVPLSSARAGSYVPATSPLTSKAWCAAESERRAAAILALAAMIGSGASSRETIRVFIFGFAKPRNLRKPRIELKKIEIWLESRNDITKPSKRLREPFAESTGNFAELLTRFYGKQSGDGTGRNSDGATLTGGIGVGSFCLPPRAVFAT
jgi:hypothetical protein